MAVVLDVDAYSKEVLLRDQTLRELRPLEEADKV